jgi:hypothetical protein
MKVYICGKITGLPIEKAKQNFKNCEIHLMEDGYSVVNPIELPEHEAIIVDTNLSIEEQWYLHMKTDIKALMDCDGIFVMTNYTESKGATIEYELAMKLGLFGLYQNTSTADLTL